MLWNQKHYQKLRKVHSDVSQEKQSPGQENSWLVWIRWIVVLWRVLKISRQSELNHWAEALLDIEGKQIRKSVSNNLQHLPEEVQFKAYI